MDLHLIVLQIISAPDLRLICGSREVQTLITADFTEHRSADPPQIIMTADLVQIHRRSALQEQRGKSGFLSTTEDMVP